MKYISIIIGSAILAVWLFLAVSEVRSAMKQHSWSRAITFFGAAFIAIGAIGFFGSALAAMGAFNWLPSSFEWPVGHAHGVVSTKDHYFVVPHTPSGRVQLYDNNWKFLQGWNVDAGAGTFKLFITDTNHIHVVTARGQKHYAYDLDGHLLASATYPASGTGYSSFPSEGESYLVPTPVWLWVFSSPFFSWLAAAAGFGLFIARDKMQKRRGKTDTRTAMIRGD